MSKEMHSVKKKVVVKNKLGLHARPAALFVQIANKFDADVTVTKDDVEVNGKSIMGILMLAAEKDSSITIIATGKDAQEAISELEKIVGVDDIEQMFRPAAESHTEKNASRHHGEKRHKQ